MKRDYQKRPATAARWWALALLIFIVVGCAGPGRQAVPEGVLSPAQSKQTILQEQLLAQIGKATLMDYQDYAVGPEDLLDIIFSEQNDLHREVRVNGKGEISLPLVETVKVEGLSPREIEQRLVKAYQEGEFINRPQITVQVKEYRHQRVMVTGAVVIPGSLEVIGPRTLLEVLGKAGGLKENAGDMVYIIRSQSAQERRKSLKKVAAQPLPPGSETIIIDLRRLLSQGDLKLNVPINNGDIVNVPPAKNAYVLGAVNKPGNVPVKDNLTVSQAVAMSGGLHLQLASNNVTIVRFDDQGQRLTIPVNLGRVTSGSEVDPLLQTNDVVFVQENMVRRVLYDFKNLNPVPAGASVPLF